MGAKAIDPFAPSQVLCSDSSWNPNPETWDAAQVDSELAAWWKSSASSRGSRTFVDWISSSFGDRSQRQQCGIGKSSSCSAPDCQSFKQNNGPRWVYFVRISLVQLNTLLNNIDDALDSTQSQLSLVIPELTDKFFEWKDPKTNLKKSVVYLQAMVEGALSMIPSGAWIAKVPQAVVRKYRDPVITSSSAFAAAGLSTLAGPDSATLEAEHDQKTIRELGAFYKRSIESYRQRLDTWATTLFKGDKDGAGHTIMDYMAAGRWSFDYSFPLWKMGNLFFQLQVSQLVNQQMRDHAKDHPKTFVMCANSTNSLCHDSSLFIEDGRACCLYTLDDGAKYQNSTELQKLQGETYKINMMDITASSLHSYLAAGFDYKFNITDRIQESISLDEGKQFFTQGIGFEG
jgi:hypothetical protein